MEVIPKQDKVTCMTTYMVANPRLSGSNLQAYELECKKDVGPDICTLMRDWRAQLLAEYSENKFTCELMDSFICDDQYEVEDEIIFYKD